MLKAQFLGQFRLRVDGRDLDNLNTRKSRSLIAYLILNAGRRFPREVLADAIWGDAPTDIQKALRQELWTLRNAFKAAGADPDDYLVTPGDEIGLSEKIEFSIDASEFESFLEGTAGSPAAPASDHEAATLTQALDIYQGELLPGHYEDWCLYPREALRIRFLTALEAMMHFHQVRGEWDGAIQFGTRLLDADPILEHVHRKMMIYHYAKGDRAVALRLFAQFKRMLMNELGVAPMSETIEVYERIKAEAPPPEIIAIGAPLPGSANSNNFPNVAMMPPAPSIQPAESDEDAENDRVVTALEAIRDGLRDTDRRIDRVIQEIYREPGFE